MTTQTMNLDHQPTPDLRGAATAVAPTRPAGTARTGRSRCRLRVLILDDHALFAECLDLALTTSGHDVQKAELPTNPARSARLLTMVCRTRPDVVVLDLDLGAFGDGARLIPSLVQSGAAVVVVTADEDQARWGECMRYGARKVISKMMPLNEIVATLRRLGDGLPVLQATERQDLIRRWHENRVQEQVLRTKFNQLTVRESEILGHLTHGRTVRDIATLSVVSEATVRTQVKSILAKLGVSSQIAAVAVAHQVDWRSPVD
ncbi:response regulator transcription factor [Nocardioides conyzicola]|uniref:Response regulator transcription factor n=1 Tax=Nocardioides conyzicola TaxID=1651781 RepID=A0ABP8XQA3_9ACTN